jgi:hypothetical protein
MRFPRVKADSHGFYHCVSRVVEGRFIFQVSDHGSVEAERFIKLMRCLEAFSGVRVLIPISRASGVICARSIISIPDTWIRSLGPKLRLAPVGRYATPAVRQPYAIGPFKVNLYRCQLPSVTGQLSVVHVVDQPDDRMETDPTSVPTEVS